MRNTQSGNLRRETDTRPKRTPTTKNIRCETTARAKLSTKTKIEDAEPPNQRGSRHLVISFLLSLSFFPSPSLCFFLSFFCLSRSLSLYGTTPPYHHQMGYEVQTETANKTALPNANLLSIYMLGINRFRTLSGASFHVIQLLSLEQFYFSL